MACPEPGLSGKQGQPFRLGAGAVQAMLVLNRGLSGGRAVRRVVVRGGMWSVLGGGWDEAWAGTKPKLGRCCEAKEGREAEIAMGQGDLERRGQVGSSRWGWDAFGFGRAQLGEAGLWVEMLKRLVWSWRGDGPVLPGWGW